MDDLPTVPQADTDLPGQLELGAFSLSLNVADLDASRSFYEALGFVVSGGDADGGYLILKNGETTLGLFHGMFDTNTLTFNPGLTNRMERLERFLDVRRIQERLAEAGIEPVQAVAPEAGTAGPAHLVVVDPDGNPILIDQFF
jgi:catechol 2,3-dioxygenase-like lactoylglutathione lyase family enzyme